MTVKERHKRKLLEYIGNPENDFLCREKLAVRALKIRRQTLYSHFTPDELSEIESEALAIRRTKYGAQLAKVDQSLLREAIAGDVAAAKLAYQRFEGWTEKKHINGKVNILNLGEIKIAFIDAKAPFADDEPEGIMHETPSIPE